MFSISIAFVNTLCWILLQPLSTTFPWRSHKNIPNIKTVGKFWRIDMGCTLKHLHSVKCLKCPLNRAFYFLKKNCWVLMPIMKAWKWETPGSMINEFLENYQKIWSQKDILQFKQNPNINFCNNREANPFAIKKCVQRDMNGMCLKGLKLINSYTRSKMMNQLGILNNFSSINNIQQRIIQNRFQNCSRLSQDHLLLPKCTIERTWPIFMCTMWNLWLKKNIHKCFKKKEMYIIPWFSTLGFYSHTNVGLIIFTLLFFGAKLSPLFLQ